MVELILLGPRDLLLGYKATIAHLALAGQRGCRQLQACALQFDAAVELLPLRLERDQTILRRQLFLHVAFALQASLSHQTIAPSREPSRDLFLRGAKHRTLAFS